MTGNNDNNWSNPNNWSPIGVPNSSANIVIPEGLINYPTISSNSSITVNKLLITSGSTLIVEEGSSLSGEITYQRFLSATQWYFMTSPVVENFMVITTIIIQRMRVKPIIIIG